MIICKWMRLSNKAMKGNSSWFAMVIVLSGVLFAGTQVSGNTCSFNNMVQFMTLAPNDLPLCGNGVLDEGEVCDDGNRVGGDGCNGWCTAFDRMSKACTLAGQNRGCTRSTTLASSPSQSYFCSLSSVAIAPDGKYLVVADGGTLVRMDLYTDSVLNNLFTLPASESAVFGKFCSIFIVKGSSQSIAMNTVGGKDEDIIIAHDCENQNIVVFIYGGSSYIIKATLPLQKQSMLSTFVGSSNNNMKGYLDQEANQLVLAGLPLVKDGLKCVEIHGVDLDTFKVSLLGTMDCVAFNVIENGRKYPSFSMEGMVPYRVLREPCPFQMNALQCYVVFMERNDMQLAKAYISVDGGTDIEYSVSTDPTVNVLGAPLVSKSEKSKITYTLTGNCFTATNTILSTMKMMPPVFALGYSCGPLPFGSGKCSMPLNNPFITDIVTPTDLLPSGLSSSHEHQELLDIFMQGNASGMLDNSTQSDSEKMLILGGLPLYRQILDNTHKGSVPIDFVELPQTQDVIYITETTIGMINTKGMMLMDLYNPGYCRPIEAILCPSGFYGSVGGVCKLCNEDDPQLDGVSAQIQCSGLISSSRRRRRRNLLSDFQSAPYTQVSMVVSNTLQKNDIDILMKFFLIAHGYNCSEVSAMSGYQPYNRAADMQDANIIAQQQSSGTDNKCTELIPCIIESAGKNMRKNLSLAVPEEYLISWTLQNSSLVNALAKLKPAIIGDSSNLKSTGDMIDKGQAAQCGISDTMIDTLVRSRCMIWLNGDFHLDWLPCVLGILNGSASNYVVAAPSGRRRHLLQVAPENTMVMVAVPLAQATFVSSTTISWGVLSQSKSSLDTGNNNGGGNKNTQNNNNGNDSNAFMIIILAGVIGGLLITILIVGILYMYFFRTTSSVVTTNARYLPTTSGNMMEYHMPPTSTRALYFPLEQKYR